MDHESTNDNERTALAPRASDGKPRGTIAYLKERVTALAVRGLMAMYDGQPTNAHLTIAEMEDLASAALDVAHDHVAADGEASETDLRRVENTRRAVMSVLHGRPAVLRKRDAFYTIGALLDAGLGNSISEILTRDVSVAAPSR